MYGNEEDDTISGGEDDDFLVGGGGDDLITGDAGNDVMWGGFKKHNRPSFDLASGINFTNPPGFDLYDGIYPTGFVPPWITPVVLNGLSIDGDANDGINEMYGNAGTDWMFGGAEADIVHGGPGDDYVDGGLGTDDVRGQGGDDIVRGGGGSEVVLGDYQVAPGDNPVIFGDEGIDQVYGDGGSDFLFGGPAPALPVEPGLDGRLEQTSGQRLYGGDGIDFLYAWAALTLTDNGFEGEYALKGDELHGGAGGDWLWGNLRQDILLGDSGNDFLHGDYLSGQFYAESEAADIYGAADRLLGGSGEDQLLGGGGDDELRGGANTDWLEGQGGNDTLLGGTDIDFMVLDTRRVYFAPDGVGEDDVLPPVDQLETAVDTFDGYYGNEFRGDLGLDDATDIMLIEGTNQRDTILIGQLADGRIHVNFTTQNPSTGAVESWQIIAPWRANVTDAVTTQDYFDPLQPLDPLGTPLVEQFRISGLMRDDEIRFVAEPYVAYDGTPAAVTVFPLDIGDLNARSDDFVGVIDGGPGDDVLSGTAGRDRIDGGSGSDTIYGLAGDDRLWGDSTAGSETPANDDYDIFFGGRGDDDLIGGPGINDLYTWTQHPLPAGDTQFGVFVNGDDPAGPVFDDDGDLDGDGLLDDDPTRPARILEDTGLDRMLGSQLDDRLYGGTGVVFMYGNGGDDVYYRADGSEFQSIDGGLGGDEWKEYARENGKVWYVGGTDADDVMTVDFVTEPGLLRDHHLITRLTDNNGNYSFAAQVRLDFGAVDEDGNPVWDAQDAIADLDALAQRGEDQNPENPDPGIPVGTASTSTQALVDTGQLDGLLPPEGDFDVILVDGLGGNDRIDVGPTVQKTVWIDGGPGDDRVTITGGNAILVDKSEHGVRNDSSETAYDLGTDLAESAVFTGLTIDNPEDLDWYRFSLESINPGAQLILSSRSEKDGLELALFELETGDSVALSPSLQLGRDRTDLEVSHDTIETAYDLGDIENLNRVTGLTIHEGPTETVPNPGDVDVFEITLFRDGINGDQVRIDLLDEEGNVVAADAETAPIVRVIDLDGLDAGTYYLRVLTLGAPARYELAFQVPELRTTESTYSDIANGASDRALNLGTQSLFPRVTGSVLQAGAEKWYSFDLQRDGELDDVIRLTSTPGPMQMALIAIDDALVETELATTSLDPDGVAELNLNGQAPGTYHLKVFGAVNPDGTGFELSPGDKPTDRTIVETETEVGGAPVFTREEIRTVREYGQSLVDLSGKQISALDLSTLDAGKAYLLRVTSPNRLPTIYDLSFDLGDGNDPRDNETNLSAKTTVTRRDVILGGAGHDALQGGPGEDWIFGGPGNDVLSGGYDRQAEDLLFGEEGDDAFQILPDGLPFIRGTQETYVPTLTDRFDGGPGDDRVLFQGGDYDRLSRPVPDLVSIRWNRFLQRYEFTAVPWDIANQQFDIGQQVVNATKPGPLEGWVGTVTFSIRVPDPEQPGRGFVDILANIDATDITGVAGDIQAALNAEFGFDADGNPVVAVVFPDGVLRIRTNGVGLELRADENDAMITVMGFAPLSSASPIYHQTYAFYQTISVEKTVIDTRAGDDMVRADTEYKFPNVPGEWGIDPGDYEQRALIGGLEIYGGDGNDMLFGGALGDRIYGGADSDVIFGGGGDDLLFGGPGAISWSATPPWCRMPMNLPRAAAGSIETTSSAPRHCYRRCGPERPSRD
ncbi:Alkaline phosphatase (EC [Olavius algarvensis associated proteobacterium Delta 3]|nr:Alkaline phosphatase (EC [Olavius algarvensis associated proteobacterium Delta 3]